MPPTITVMMGVPGAGKSTWCAHHTNGAHVLAVDSIKKGAKPSAVFRVVARDAKLALIHGEDVIIDACSTRWKDRALWKNIARTYRARTRLVVVDTPPKEAARRDSLRENPVGSSETYAKRMKYAKKRMLREGWDEIFVVSMVEAV